MNYISIPKQKPIPDAMQDTFYKVYKNYISFKGDCQEKTWVMKKGQKLAAI